MADSSRPSLIDAPDGASPTIDFGLLANFVHQIINPLNGVSGTLGNLIDGTIALEKRPQRLRAARAQLEHAISLARNLAYFSQISIDPRNTNPGAIRKSCVIPQIIVEAIQFYQETAASKEIAVEHTNSYDQFKVDGNPDLLRQVFMNLIDNAVKYSDPKTKISIVSRLQEKSDTLFVEIANTGAQIPPDERQRIFELGFRGANAKRRVASGTGLGLHICRTIIEGVHGGSVDVESTSAGRTVFTIRFPNYSQQRAANDESLARR